MDDCLELECDPELVTVARAFIRDRLTSWGATEHLADALVVTSELVTNAVLHARTALTCRVEVHGDTVRIEVFDENPRLPVVAPCPPEATSGRGLALITTLASAWGMEHRENGKAVWAELGPVSSDTPDECLDLTGVETVEEAVERIGSPDEDTAA